MGYYTDYKLSAQGKQVENLVEIISDITDYDWSSSLMLQDVKWYDNEEHMRKLSKMFPNTLFILEGKGEESGDIWKAYHNNGKCYQSQAKIMFEDFDEDKLK